MLLFVVAFMAGIILTDDVAVHYLALLFHPDLTVFLFRVLRVLPIAPFAVPGLLRRILFLFILGKLTLVFPLSQLSLVCVLVGGVHWFLLKHINLPLGA